ncbi:DUF6900 domain-containing protein [Alterileibacterium massiliense]|uniref:DUF6900 domain-containing protein n=1 Tax=Alterileibacterium massiliense TaxID=1870997 RepID=UPI0008DA4DF5|nr:hypothetical protein [Alterileibacterium massiliense]
MTKKIEKTLLAIAKKNNWEVEERGDLETRHSDQDDFIEVSVWGLKAMLEEAYAAGKTATK